MYGPHFGPPPPHGFYGPHLGPPPPHGPRHMGPYGYGPHHPGEPIVCCCTIN